MDFPCNKLKKIGDAKGNTQGFLSINRIRECEIGSSHFGSIILLNRPFYININYIGHP